jgi:hypothetical protein
MSKEQLQKVGDTEVIDMEDEDLLEFKASMGDESELPDPQVKKTDEKPKGKGEPMLKLNTKAGMINAAVQIMSNMKKEDLKAAYGKMVNSDDDDDDDDDDDQEKVSETKNRRPVKITTEDIDVTEDVEAMFNGSDLDETFKDKIATIFEAAVVAKVNEQVEKIAIEAESDFEVSTTEAIDELTEQVDSYLDYVVQEWVEENRLAIERGVRSDMVEDFLRGLKGLFTEHYVDIPEEKVDVVEELIAHSEDLEQKLNEQINDNVQLLSRVRNFEKETVFAEAVEDLTHTQIEKLRDLSEGVEFADAANYAKKIAMLKSQYFDIDEGMDTSMIIDDEKDPIALDEEKQGPTGAMAGYVSAISKSARK